MLKAFRECGFSCADHALDLSLKHAFKRAEAEVPELKQFRKSIKRLVKKSLKTAYIRSTVAKHGKSLKSNHFWI